MKVAIVGDGFLADAFREASPHEEVPADVADVVWVAHETTSGTDYEIGPVFRRHGRGLHVVASAVPVGTWESLRSRFPTTRFAICPENVRRAHAADDLRALPFVIAGVDSERDAAQVTELYAPFTDQIIVMDPVSAELTKHAINGFLALSVVYIRRLAKIAANIGANIEDVSRGLRSDPRIGPRAYLGVDGEPGPHLLRDVAALRLLDPEEALLS